LSAKITIGDLPVKGKHKLKILLDLESKQAYNITRCPPNAMKLDIP
jgi:hypothetical protein